MKSGSPYPAPTLPKCHSSLPSPCPSAALGSFENQQFTFLCWGQVGRWVSTKTGNHRVRSGYLVDKRQLIP